MKAFEKSLIQWIFIILLIFIVMSYGVYLINEDYIIECFSSFIARDVGSPETSHNVDQPINTKFSCKNMCGPLARCSITGEQCTSDVDCFGCVPKYPQKNLGIEINFKGDNDAGKLTMGVTPTYSPLTTDIGTNAAQIHISNSSQPPEYNQGVNVWENAFHNGYKFFNMRYKTPKDIDYIPNYPTRYTLSGEFKEDGPLESNSYL